MYRRVLSVSCCASEVRLHFASLCALMPTAGLSVLYLEYWLLSSTIFHYLSLPVIDYLLITACHRWKERASSRTCTIRWKERASSRSRRQVFHPDEFVRSWVTGQIHPGACACGFRFRHEHTYVHTDGHNQL